MFQYEIVNQVNSGLDTEYCIVNFKLKTIIVFEIEAKLKEQQLSVNAKNFGEKINDLTKLNNSNPN